MSNHSELKELFVRNTNGKTVIHLTPPEPSPDELTGFHRHRFVIKGGVMVEEEKE
jgi:hypothetical protein